MRIEQLTFTRFIAAFLIVVFHYGKQSFLFNNDYFSFLLTQANIGVSYFFILSGFVMAIVYHKGKKFNAFQYIINRFARIYPLYLLSLLLILTMHFYKFKSIDITELFLSVSMLQAWFPDMALTLNHPSWSLSVEMFFYLCFPLAFKVFKKIKLKNVAIAIISFWLISQIIYHLAITSSIKIPFYSINDFYFHPLLHLNEFLIGNLTGLFFLHTSEKSIPIIKSNLLIFILLALIVLFLTHPIGLNYHNGLLAILFAPLIFMIAKNDGSISTFFSNRVFLFLGEISFGVYLLQEPVYRLFSDYRLEKIFGILNNGSDNTVNFFIRFILLLIFSSITYKFVESPLRELIKKLGVKIAGKQ